MKNWIKNALGITKLEQENKRLQKIVADNGAFVSAKISELKDYTRVDADIGVRGNNTIVLTGVYRKQAYVRFYDLGDGQFKSLVEQLREMKGHCLMRNIDTPPQIRGTFEI